MLLYNRIQLLLLVLAFIYIYIYMLLIMSWVLLMIVRTFVGRGMAGIYISAPEVS